VARAGLGGQNTSLELNVMKRVDKVSFIAKENSFKTCFVD